MNFFTTTVVVVAVMSLAAPAAASTTTSSSPSVAVDSRVPAGFPDASTTGVPAGVVLTPRVGDVVVKQSGTVLDGLDIQGCVTVRADDVTIRRSRIRCAGQPGNWPVRIGVGFRGLLVEDVEIDGRGVATVAVQGENYTLRRVDVHDVIDGPRLGSNTVVEDSYIHDLTHLTGTHNDALQTLGGDNIIVRRNTLLAYNATTDDPNNGAIQTGSLSTPLTNMVVESNYMNGGSYTVRGGATPRDGDKITNYVFRHNVFGRECGFGPVSGIGAPVTWEHNNHWVDDPVNPILNDPIANKTGCTKRQRSIDTAS